MEAGMRESYGPAADRLAAYATGASAASLATLADELLAIAALLGREHRLRRALTDPARGADDRVELARNVLDGKVEDEALGLIGELVRPRWSSPGALRDAAERLGVDALMASAERAGELGEVEDELFRFAQVIDGAPQLAGVLGDAGAPVGQRAALVGDLLGREARRVTVALGPPGPGGVGGP